MKALFMFGPEGLHFAQRTLVLFFFLGQLVVPVRYGRMMALRVHLLDLADFGDA